MKRERALLFAKLVLGSEKASIYEIVCRHPPYFMLIKALYTKTRGDFYRTAVPFSLVWGLMTIARSQTAGGPSQHLQAIVRFAQLAQSLAEELMVVGNEQSDSQWGYGTIVTHSHSLAAAGK